MSGKQGPDTNISEGLRRHIPELAIEWALDCPEQRWRNMEGTLLFADISGFTALAERLAQRGRVGGEELVETLSRVFATMLDIAHQRGGILLKFGGDALLLFFEGDEHALNGAAAAVEMRTALRQAARTPTSVGPLKLSMSVGIHSGDVLFFLIGATHRELILLGPAADTVVETENAAEAGQILLSDAAAAMLPATAVTERDDGRPLLRWRRAPRLESQPPPERQVSDKIIAGLFPDHLGRHLVRVPEPEHRVACIAFIKFSGTDALLEQRGAAALAEALDETVAEIQRALATEDINLLAIDVDRDGGKFFLGAGVPYAHEDDEGRMLRALRSIAAKSLPLPLQFGVNRGHVFAAEVGSVRRAAYSAMGDTTNTAARIASKAPPGKIYAHPSVLDESLTLFQVTPAGPFEFKGKKAPMLVYEVGEETGTRRREGIEAFEFVGRREELKLLLAAVADLANDRGRVIRVVADPGMGKSRLLHEAINAAADITVVEMRAEPYGATSSYRLFRGPLLQVLGIPRGDHAEMAAALEQLTTRVAPQLVPYLSLIGDVLHIDIEPSEAVEAIEPGFRGERRAAVLCELLDAAKPGPLMLVVDDAHWADEASVELLSAMARACVARPWLLVVARRDLAGGFDPVEEQPLHLGPIPDTQLKHLIDAVTEAAPLRPEQTREILRRSAGNPLFAMEILRTVRDVGSLDAVPDSLEAAMATQVDTLDADARRLLRYSTVLGRSFSLNVLSEALLTENLVPDLGAMERLNEYLEPDGEDRVRFRTGLLRDVVYGSLAYRLRKRLHLAAGEAIERTTPDPATAADALALHFSLGDSPLKTLHYGRLAAERARANYANQDAATLYEIAINAARQVPDVDPGDTLQLWVELGDVRELAGLFDAALEAYGRALKLVDDPIERADLMLKRARARERAGRFSAALRELSQAKRLLPEDSGDLSVLARLQSFRAMVLMGQERPRKALRAAEEAIRTATAANEQASLVRCLTLFDFLNMELYGSGDSGSLQRALSIANELGDLYLQASVQMNLGILNYHAGHWDDAAKYLNAARELDIRRGDVLNGAMGAAQIGEILVSQHRFDEAQALLSETLRDMRAMHSAEAIANIELQLIRIRLAHGDYTAAEEMSRRVAEDFEAIQQVRHADEARLLTCDALRLLGEASQAWAIVENAATSEVGYLGARTALTRAALLTDLERFSEAAAEIDTGLEIAREQNLLYEEAQLLMARCRLASAMGRTPDPKDLADYQMAFDRLGVRKTPSPLNEMAPP